MRGRLLIVSNFFPPDNVGGAEIVAYRQAKMMCTEGWDVRVFAGDLSEELQASKTIPSQHGGLDDLRVIRTRFHRPKVGGDAYNKDTIPHFATVLREFKPTIVHFHHLWGLGAGLLDVATRAGTKAIVTLHDRWGFCFKSTLLRNDFSPCLDFTECHKCLRTFRSPDGALPIRLRNDYVMSRLNLADTVIAPSWGLADDYIQAGLSQDRITVVSSGIDLVGIAPRLRDPGDVVHFLCPAHLGEHKGFRELLAALTLLFNDRSLRGRWTFWIAGSGHLEGFLRSKIVESGLNRHVILSGPLEHQRLLARLAVSDVVVLPSICAENQPRSLLEGIASGAALVASRVKGSAELVQNGGNGILYEPSDPAALADALRQLIVSKGLIRTFSQANLSLRARYDERQTASRLAEIYAAPPRATPATDLLVRCGIAAPGTKLAVSKVEQAPRAANGKRVRLMWWGWLAEDEGVSAPIWVFRLGWRPWRWLAAYRRYKIMHVSKTLDLTNNWTSKNI
ncbi:MAG: glycosyltransferase [Xanthobacteraceae bacterium]|nr:glycosyltransferase [Xanthobacteraceae bacterium]